MIVGVYNYGDVKLMYRGELSEIFEGDSVMKKEKVKISGKKYEIINVTYSVSLNQLVLLVDKVGK
jgi:hypothetical protein